MTVLGACLPVWGSLRLIGLRVVVQLIAATPALVAVHFSQVAHRPYFTEPTSRSAQWLFLWLQQGLDGASPWFGLALVLGVLLDQVVTAGAIRWLDPDVEHGRFEWVGPAVIGDGTRWLWPQLRVVALAAVAGGAWMAAGGAAIAAATNHFDEPLRLAAMAIVALGVLTIGGLSHLAQVVTVGDKRRVVRRALWLTAKLAWRHPFAGPAFYVLAAGAVAPLPGLALVGWRLANPGTDWTIWGAYWLGALVVQAVVWHALIRIAWALFTRQTDLRSTPDEGFGVWGWVRAKAGRGSEA